MEKSCNSAFLAGCEMREIGQIDVWIKRFKGRRLMVILSACVVLLLMSGMAGVEAQQSTPPHYELVVNYDLSDIEWNPDGTLLAISGGDSVTIYDINLQELATLQGHLGAVFS